MTIEEKAKAYDEALKLARAMHDVNYTDSYTKANLEEIFPELRESEDERMRKRAIAILKQQRDYWSYDGPVDKFPPATPRKDLVDAIDVALSYLEKQKEPTTEEFYAEAGTTEKEYIANTMKMVRAMREKKQDQKPNIELIQRSWYMEGYNERDFGKESKWIIKTGDDGPEYEENPKYGQMLEAEQNPTCSEEDKQWLSEVYFAIDHSMYSRDERRSMKKYIDSLRSQSKTAEWSEEDEKNLKQCIEIVRGWEIDYDYANPHYSNWLKCIRPSWKPNEEQMTALEECGECKRCIKELREQLKKL